MFNTEANEVGRSQLRSQSQLHCGAIAGLRQALAGALTNLAAVIGARHEQTNSSTHSRPAAGGHPMQLQSPALARWSRERDDPDAFNRRLQQVFVEAAMPTSAITVVPMRHRRS